MRARVAVAEKHSATDVSPRGTSSKRTRPVRNNAGTLAMLASPANAVVDAGALMGPGGDGASPKSIAKSHVLNGAVNGARIRMARQHAMMRDTTVVSEEQASRHSARRTLKR